MEDFTLHVQITFGKGICLEFISFKIIFSHVDEILISIGGCKFMIILVGKMEVGGTNEALNDLNFDIKVLL